MNWTCFFNKTGDLTTRNWHLPIAMERRWKKLKQMDMNGDVFLARFDNQVLHLWWMSEVVFPISRETHQIKANCHCQLDMRGQPTYYLFFCVYIYIHCIHTHITYAVSWYVWCIMFGGFALGCILVPSLGNLFRGNMIYSESFSKSQAMSITSSSTPETSTFATKPVLFWLRCSWRSLHLKAATAAHSSKASSPNYTLDPATTSS
jgi:hypothetical protein